MNGSQIETTIERLRALLAEARAQTTPAEPPAATERLAAIDAGLEGLAG